MMISISVQNVSADCLKLSIHSLDSVAFGTDWRSQWNCQILHPVCLSIHLSIQVVLIDRSGNSRDYLWKLQTPV